LQSKQEVELDGEALKPESAEIANHLVESEASHYVAIMDKM